MRVDGRSKDMLRLVKITKGFIKSAEGSVLIEMGDTKVICTATIEENVPGFLKDTGKGWVSAEYGMLARSTDKRMPREGRTGRVSGRTHEIQRLVGRSLRSVTDMGRLGERTIWIDCDVIQADGGTRTASVTGGFVALVDAMRFGVENGLLENVAITDYLAAISVGLVGGQALLDLCYKEDSKADVDMNVVMDGSGRFIEVQSTAEGTPFYREELNELIDLAQKGINELITEQKKVLDNEDFVGNK